MKRMALPLVLGILAAGGMLSTGPSPAEAKKTFKQEFEAKYIKPASSNPNDIALREAFQQAGCNVCHIGPKKKTLNPYARELQKLLRQKSEATEREKLLAAFDKVADIKSNPDDPKSPTFGELIAAGKLPAGNTK